RIVVEQKQIGAPIDRGRGARLKTEAERLAQRRRPCRERAQRARGPRVLADAPAHLAAFVQEGRSRRQGSRRRGFEFRHRALTGVLESASKFRATAATRGSISAHGARL